MADYQAAVFTLMVDNEFGVLTRITALIRRAGWNIRSLAVGETEKPGVSRLTVCLECKNNTLEFVLEKLRKLNCVREISIFSSEDQISQEMSLIRIKKEALPKLDGLNEDIGIRTLFENEYEALLAITCRQEQMDGMLAGIRGAGLLEMARTGAIAVKIPDKEETR